MSQEHAQEKNAQPVQNGKSGPVLLALGANLPSAIGPPEATIRAAIGQLSHAGFELIAASRLYRTPAFPPGNGPDYVNAAISCSCPFAPDDLLRIVNAVEALYGRQRSKRWEARSLDIDVIAIGESVLPGREEFEAWESLTPDLQQMLTPSELIVPHPRLHERAFVLVPLAEVAPRWRHPVMGRDVDEMLEALPADQRAMIRPIPLA